MHGNWVTRLSIFRYMEEGARSWSKRRNKKQRTIRLLNVCQVVLKLVLRVVLSRQAGGGGWQLRQTLGKV